MRAAGEDRSIVMLVRELMTTEVVSVTETTSLADSLALLAGHHITALPVLGPSRDLVGIVSEADILRQMSTAQEASPGTPTPSAVSQLMRRHPITVSIDTDISTAADLMTCTAIKSLPVLLNGRVVGIISRSDLIRCLARQVVTDGSGGARAHGVTKSLFTGTDIRANVE